MSLRDHLQINNLGFPRDWYLGVGGEDFHKEKISISEIEAWGGAGGVVLMRNNLEKIRDC